MEWGLDEVEPAKHFLLFSVYITEYQQFRLKH